MLILGKYELRTYFSYLDYAIFFVLLPCSPTLTVAYSV